MTRDEIYTPLEEAREEIHRRWADRELRRRVEDFLGGPPPGAGDRPCAFLSRTVPTPNREFHRYVELSARIGLPAVPLEYLEDRYCTLNPDKLGLVRMTFFRGHDHGGRPIFRRTMITNGDIAGKPFTTIRTLWDEPLASFHRRLLSRFFPEIAAASEARWLRRHGGVPREFYPAHFARFLCHGIFFETYLALPDEIDFDREVVFPSFAAVASRFGLHPLVVRLLPRESSEDPAWTWYGSEVEAIVERELRRVTPGRSRR